MTGSKQVVHWTSETWWEWSEITGSPQSSPLAADSWLWSWKEDLQRAWNRDRKAVWDQVGLSHCQHEGLVTVRDEARLRWGNDDQSRQGHQCSETTLTGESQFHISTPLGIWTLFPCDGKQTGSPRDQWDMVRMKWDCRLFTCVYKNINATYIIMRKTNNIQPFTPENNYLLYSYYFSQCWNVIKMYIYITLLEHCDDLGGGTLGVRVRIYFPGVYLSENTIRWDNRKRGSEKGGKEKQRQ